MNAANRFRFRLWAACLLPLAVCLLFAQRRIDSPNVSSRMDTIQSLVERGTFCIDDSLNKFMVDVVKIHGRFYSDKPPLLSILGAAVYLPLHGIFGLSFNRHAPLLYYLLTVLFVGVPLAVALRLFAQCLFCAGLPESVVTKATFLTGAGTLFLPYSVTFLNHVPAAAAVIASLYCLLRSEAGDERRGRWLAAAGGLAAVAFNFDLAPGGMVLLGFAALAFLQKMRPRDVLAFGAGAAGPVGLYFFLNFLVTHDLRPIYLHPQYYEYEGSILRSYDALKTVYGKSVFTRVFHMTFGYRGLFLYSPILLFGLWEAVRRTARPDRFRPLAIFSLLSVIVVSAAYAWQTAGMAGGSYGMRWLLPLIPFFAFFMAFALDRPAERWKRIGFRAAAGISIAVAVLGVPRPWSSNIRSPFTFLDNMAYFAQALWPPAKSPVYWIVDWTSLEKDYAYFEIGRWHMNHGYFRQAVRDLEHARRLVDRRRARSLEPGGTVPDYFNLIDDYLGRCYGRTGRPDLAVAAYERLLARDPRNTVAWNNYAVSLLQMNLPERAMAAYRRSLEIDPNKVFTHQSIAQLYLKLRKIDEAEKHWKRALELDPANVEVRRRMANLYWQKGERQEALEQLRAIESLRPADEEVRRAIRKLEAASTATSPAQR